MKKILTLIAALLVCMIDLRADTQAIDFTSITHAYDDGNWTMGFAFNVSSSVSVNGLGMFDYGKDGFVLGESHPVGLWTDTGTLIASVWVSSSDPLLGWFRYATIPTVTLGAGNYVVAGPVGYDPYTWDPIGFTTAPGITYLGDRLGLFGYGQLGLPTLSDDHEAAWFGANFRIEDSTEQHSVADAGLTSLMMAGGLGLLTAMRRRIR